MKSLQWRHNGRDTVSNHQPHDCLLNRLFRLRSKKTSKLRVIGICAGNSPVPGEFHAQMASNAENVSIWWRHHYIWPVTVCSIGKHPILFIKIVRIRSMGDRSTMYLGQLKSYSRVIIKIKTKVKTKDGNAYQYLLCDISNLFSNRATEHSMSIPWLLAPLKYKKPGDRQLPYWLSKSEISSSLSYAI